MSANVIDVLNKRIKRNGISVTELSRRVGMRVELTRRSLIGIRNLRATEFVAMCKELDLDIDDFSCDVDESDDSDEPADTAD